MKVIQLHQEEKQLIMLAVENNRQAQQQIYIRFSSKMLSCMYIHKRHSTHAEDVMITGFMKVFTNLKILNTKVVLKVGFEELWCMDASFSSGEKEQFQSPRY